MLTLNSLKITFISSALIPLVLCNNQFQVHIVMVSPLCTSNHDIQSRVLDCPSQWQTLQTSPTNNSHALSVMTSSQGHIGFRMDTARQERAGKRSRLPSAHLSNGVCTTHMYDTLLTALRVNSMRSHWTLPMLCRAMAEAYSMKPRSDRLFGLSNYQVVCDCEWIILKFYPDSDLC